MKKLALISALLLAASPAAAQLATSQRVQQLNGQSVQTTPTVAPTTGVFCIEEMTATFCNVTTGPNTSGYGSRGVSTSSRGAASSGVSASALVPSVRPFRHAGANRRSTNCATDQREPRADFVSAPIPLSLARFPMTARRACGRLSGGLFVPLAGDRQQHLALSRNPLLSLFRWSGCT